MAILCLASDIDDLKRRLGSILVAYTYSGEPVYARDLKADGAMTALLKDAIKPNLVQTLEGTPAVKVSAIEMFDINGRRVAKAQKGLVIMKQIMSDGSIRTQKVVK